MEQAAPNANPSHRCWNSVRRPSCLVQPWPSLPTPMWMMHHQCQSVYPWRVPQWLQNKSSQSPAASLFQGHKHHIGPWTNTETSWNHYDNEIPTAQQLRVQPAKNDRYKKNKTQHSLRTNNHKQTTPPKLTCKHPIHFAQDHCSIGQRLRGWLPLGPATSSKPLRTKASRPRWKSSSWRPWQPEIWQIWGYP